MPPKVLVDLIRQLGLCLVISAASFLMWKYLFCISQRRMASSSISPCASPNYSGNFSLIMSPPSGLGDILFLPQSVCPSIWLSVCQSITKSCPLCNLKTVQDIFMKLHININQHWTTCRAQEPLLLDIYFLSYAPLNFVSSSFCDKIVSAL